MGDGTEQHLSRRRVWGKEEQWDDLEQESGSVKPALLEDSVESGRLKGGWDEGVPTQQENESQVCKGKNEGAFSKETQWPSWQGRE